MGAHGSPGRARTSIPKPQFPDSTSRDPKAAQLLLQDKIRDFKAENELLGRLLKEVQAERQCQERRLDSCHSQISHLEQELRASKSQCTSLEREVQDLSIAGAKKDKQLQQSLATRRELEALVLELNEQLAQPRQPLASQPHHVPAPQAQHTCLTVPPTEVLYSSAGSPPPQQSAPQAMPQGCAAYHSEPWSPPGHTRAGRGAGTSPGKSRVHPDLRYEVARLEELYQSKLRLVQQEAAQKLAALQRESQEARAAAKAAAQSALQAVREEVVQQVAEAEAGLERQVQQQLRVLDQLHKRCAALESHLVTVQLSCTPAAQHQLVSGAPHTTQDGSRRELVHLKQQVAQLRHELVQCQTSKAQAVAAADAAATALAAQSQQMQENCSRLARLRQDVCQNAEQQHELMAANTQLQQQVANLTSQLTDAEAAIKDLRHSVCDLRMKLLAAQSCSVAEVLKLAYQSASKSGDQPTEVELLNPQGAVSTYIRVLQHAVKEGDAREAALKHAVLESQHLDMQTRQLLAAARQDLLGMQRTLLKKCAQVQALGALRLRDAQELATPTPALHQA